MLRLVTYISPGRAGIDDRLAVRVLCQAPPTHYRTSAFMPHVFPLRVEFSRTRMSKRGQYLAFPAIQKSAKTSRSNLRQLNTGRPRAGVKGLFKRQRP